MCASSRRVCYGHPAWWDASVFVGISNVSPICPFPFKVDNSGHTCFAYTSAKLRGFSTPNFALPRGRVCVYDPKPGCGGNITLPGLYPSRETVLVKRPVPRLPKYNCDCDKPCRSAETPEACHRLCFAPFDLVNEWRTYGKDCTRVEKKCVINCKRS